MRPYRQKGPPQRNFWILKKEINKQLIHSKKIACKILLLSKLIASKKHLCCSEWNTKFSFFRKNGNSPNYSAMHWRAPLKDDFIFFSNVLAMEYSSNTEVNSNTAAIGTVHKAKPLRHTQISFCWTSFEVPGDTCWLLLIFLQSSEQRPYQSQAS